ncbi:MAG: ATP-binding cassette domain-containing protein [Lentimicrobiaceae bacterium]|jgi:ABC-type lipopolysaccharide export system ATPase subunit
MSELIINTVSKKFKKRIVLSNISLRIKTGEILGIFGRNGCGKSTLLKILFGVLPSDDQEILLDNECFNPANNIKLMNISYLPQDSFLPDNLTVRDVIPLYYKDGDAQNKIFYDPRIAKIERQRIGTLSLGERRYFEILLVSRLPHKFLMLDEPFSMVEPLYQDSIKELLTEMKKEKGIIITDHYYRNVLEVSDRKMIIKNGKAIEIENETDLIENGYLREAGMRKNSA